MNPLQTPLLLLGSCSREDLPLYQSYYEEMYRGEPVLDRFGRRIIFLQEKCEHVCISRYKHDRQSDAPRDIWREDRAKRLPWIMVALTHTMSVLKQSKDPGHWAYLISMMADEGTGLICNRYQVIVKPRKGGAEAVFKTAFDKLTPAEWADAMKRKSVPRPIVDRRDEGGRV